MAVSNVELRVDARNAIAALQRVNTASTQAETATQKLKSAFATAGQVQSVFSAKVANTEAAIRKQIAALREVQSNVQLGGALYQKAGKQIAEYESKLQNANRTTSNAATALAALGASIAAARIGQYLSQGVQGFADLDNALRRLGTVGGDVKALDGELGKLSGSFGNLVSKTELAQASYDALSAGFTDTAGNIAILEASTKAAIGGQVEVADALQVTTKVLNAYGLSGEYATGVTDSISKSIEFGVVQWSDYTSQLGRVVSLAALAGVSLDEVNAFIAAATKNGATAEVAFTGLSAALSTLVKPSKESQEAAKQLGISWNISGLQAKGFSGLLDELGKKQQTNVEAAADLLGGQEAIRGVLAANAKGGKDFQMILAGLGSAAGKTEDDFQKMEVGLTNQLKRLGNNWEALRTTIIQAVIPSILSAVDEINKALETSIQFVKDYAAGWQILASAAADAVKPFESIASALGTINGQLAAIGTHKNAMSILAGFLPGGPLGPLLGAPAQLGAAKRTGGAYASPFAGRRDEAFNRIRGLPTPGLAAQSPYDQGGGKKSGADKAAKEAERAAEAAKKEAERVAEVIKDRLAEGQLIRIKSELQDKIATAENSGDKMLAARLQGQQKEIDLQYKYAQELAKEKDIRAQEAIIFEGLSALTATRNETERELNVIVNQNAKDQITALEALIGKQYELTEQQKQQKTLAEGIANTVGQGMTSAFDALIQGSEDFNTSLRKIASGVLIDIANQLLQIFVIEQAISAIKGLLGGGITGGGGFSYSGVKGSALSTSMISGNFTPVDFSTAGMGFRANGGSVTAGKPYMVGERGPELFMPGRSGGIAPANSFGGGVNVVVNVDATGSNVQGDQSQAKQLGGVISAAVQAELVKQKRPGGLLA